MNRIETKDIIRMLAVDGIGSLLLGIGVSVFAVSADFAPGGITGMGVLVNYLFHIPIGLAVIFLNIPIILGTFRLLGRKFFLSSVKTMLINAFFIDHVVCYITPFTGNRLAAAVFAGIFAGAGYALIFMQDSSTGGTDFIIMSIKRIKPNYSIGQITQVLDGSVILLAGFVYREVDVIFYGIVYTIVTSVMIDFVIRVFSDQRFPYPLRRFFAVRAF